MSRIVEPPISVVQTIKITRYEYSLSNLIPHASVQYTINCYNDNVYVKSISGILEGIQYIEWVNDDYLDAFIKAKVEELGIK
jgi:hypothetical protein